MAETGATDGTIGAAGRRAAWTAALEPYHLARYAALAAVAAAALFVWLSLAAPRADVAFAPTDRGTVAVRTSGETRELAAQTPVAFTGRGGRTVALPAARLASAEATDAPDRRDLAALLAAGPVQAQAADGFGFEMGTRATRLEDLTGAYWLALGCSLAALLFGLAVWALKPRDWGAAWFAWTGAWMFAASAADALVELWNPATGRGFVLFTVAVNAATLNVFALSFLGLFARFPSPLIPRAATARILGAAGLAAIATVAAVPAWGHGPAAALQAGAYVALLGLVAAQFFANRRDPAQRATLRLLIGSIGLGVAVYFLTTIGPALAGLKAPPSEAAVFPLMVLIYGGIGVSVVRGRLLAMDGWSRSVVLSIGFTALVLLVDLILLRWLSRQEDVALGLAFASVALVYLPVRDWLARREQERRRRQGQLALRFATDLAFATRDGERAERWRAAVEATFQPLETEVDPEPVAEPQVAEHGSALRLPALAGAPALICRHGDGGRRAFGPGEVEQAKALIALVRRMIESRDAYVAGASEERKRIARDLHDSVSGRLITSLTRNDAAAMQHDVRDAMTEIRTILTHLDGEGRPLGELLANLRHECRTRFEGAGMGFDWPVGPAFEDERLVGHAAERHLTALFRETVSNILRHAGARSARIETVTEGARLLVTIADDGRGLDGARPGGRGLRNCAQRAEALNGRFEAVGSDAGATVRFDALLTAEGLPPP